MRRLYPCAAALVLFACSVLGMGAWYRRALGGRLPAMLYYNTDSRNSCIWAMEGVLAGGAVPVFGSSELSASDGIGYPPSLFRGGASDFNMVPVGRGYMECLHHAINLGAMAGAVPGRKAVLILSPQWFRAGEISSEAYASRFSERMYAQFLKNPDISRETKQRVADRVGTLLSSDPAQLGRVGEYGEVYVRKSLNPIRRLRLWAYDLFMQERQVAALEKESRGIGVQEQEPVSAAGIDFGALMEAAAGAGKSACTNNGFYVYDEYYDKYIRDTLEEKRGSEAGSSYAESPQYGDFRLFLDICRETGIEPLIVSVPVNGYWYDWTGFPEEGREGYYQKIRDICGEYGAELADFSDREYEPYFLRDIMHMGWKGWVYFDEAVYRFCKEAP